jgi:hypothetical protein
MGVGIRSSFTLILFILIMFLSSSVHAEIEAMPHVSQSFLPSYSFTVEQREGFVDLFTGASVYVYPIEVPEGTNGLKPNINLNYNSHRTKSRPGLIGTAWDLSQNYIQRHVIIL